MNGLLLHYPLSSSKNIGDYIQSLAQAQFLTKIDCYADIERLDALECNEETNLIMNGWYMWHPEHFCLSPLVRPLFISIHISPSIADRMLTPEVVNYLKQHEPIGARDTGTEQLLKTFGIQCYLSGCLTLTLGRTYHSTVKNDTCYFVDPYFEWGGGEAKGKFIQYVRGLVDTVHFRKQVACLKSKFVGGYHHPKIEKWFPRLGKRMLVAAFYKTYSSLFEDEILFHATYLTHNVPTEKCANEEEWLEYARNLLHTYSQVKLTVTSRIHCALPCLGMETPTIFVCSEFLNKNAVAGRFGGLTDLLNVVSYKSGKIVPNQLDARLNEHGKIGTNTQVSNSDQWKKFSEQLTQTVTAFLQNKRDLP